MLTFAAVSFAWVFFRAPDLGTATHLASAMLGFTADPGAADMAGEFVPMLLGGLVIVWCLPSTMQLFARSGAILQPGLYGLDREPSPWLGRLGFRLRTAWAVGSAFVFVSAWFAMSKLSPFIYYQF